MEQDSVQKICYVDGAKKNISCPQKGSDVWNKHPLVYLSLDKKLIYV